MVVRVVKISRDAGASQKPDPLQTIVIDKVAGVAWTSAPISISMFWVDRWFDMQLRNP